MSATDLIGLIGTLLILGAYAGVQFKRLDPYDWLALVMNLAGAGLVLVSLYFKFNLASALLEAAWALIALVGLIRLALSRKQG